MVECVDSVGTQETGGCCLHGVTQTHFGPLCTVFFNVIPFPIRSEMGGKENQTSPWGMTVAVTSSLYVVIVTIVSYLNTYSVISKLITEQSIIV